VYSKTAVVRHEAGLHARPATIFIQKANSFAATITIGKDGKTVDAKSILKVLMLGLCKATLFPSLPKDSMIKTLSKRLSN
jgi:phosphocarrier protein